MDRSGSALIEVSVVAGVPYTAIQWPWFGRGAAAEIDPQRNFAARGAAYQGTGVSGRFES